MKYGNSFIGQIGKRFKRLEAGRKYSCTKKIRRLIEAIQKNPFEGIGKPEPLKHNLSGKWSRRITEEDRMVYEIEEGCVKIYSLKGHYQTSN